MPCAGGMHIGESISLGFIRKYLSNGIVLGNYHHPDSSGTLEIDLVVINYLGVWLLEVKHWWGNIDADPIHWLHAGLKHPSPLTTIEKKAKVVNSYLYEHGMGDISVVGLVVLSKGTSTLNIDDDRCDRVFGLNDDLIDALTSREFVYSQRSPILKQTQIDRLAGLLVRKHVDPEWKVIGNYRLVENLGSKEGYELWEGQHAYVQNRRALIKRYHIEAVASQKHLDESVRLFKQDMEALAQLEGQANIVQAYDFLPDPDSDDTFWLLLEYVDGETLESFLQDREVLSYQEQVDILKPIAEALEYCHQHNILHRNLSPDSIYLTDRGAIKVGNFDYARVPTLGFTISQTGEALVQSRYTAPEQLADPRTADHRADLYSLGAIWYDLAFSPSKEEPILISKLNQSDLNEDAKELMKSLLSTRPSGRPESASEVCEWLELLKGD